MEAEDRLIRPKVRSACFCLSNCSGEDRRAEEEILFETRPKHLYVVYLQLFIAFEKCNHSNFLSQRCLCSRNHSEETRGAAVNT